MHVTSIEEHILSIVCSVFDAYSAVLFLPEDDEETCTLQASFSLGQSVDRTARIAPGHGLVGWIVRNHQVLCVPNFDHYQSKLGYYLDREEESIKAFMGCPLSCGGVLCLDSKRQYAFSEKDNKILQLFAELVARLRAQKGEETFLADIPRYFADLGVLQDLPFRYKRWSEYVQQFLDTVRASTGFDYAAFAALDNPGESYAIEAETSQLLLCDGIPHSLSINEGVVGWVFKNEQAVICEGYEDAPYPVIFGKLPDIDEFKAVMCMPITVDRSTNAVLCLTQRSSRHIDESLRSFVNQAVQQMSFFLENLRLRTKLNSYLPKVQLHGDYYGSGR
ncbi:MAG: GAF domain-containing protein [Desulfovibrio sp.]|nr:GAF domain-containing protein [Desulfovibrio sp.]